MKNHFKRFCHVGSVYSLLVYIAYSTDEQLKNTFYIFDWMISKEFAQKFKNVYHYRKHKLLQNKWYFSYIDLMFQKYFLCKHIPKDAKLFANDHLWSSSAIIGRHKYTLLEDAARICSMYWYGKKRTDMEYNRKTKSYKLRRLLLGPVEVHPHGDNVCCTELLLTTDDHPDYIKNKLIYKLNWNGLWETFSSWKKDFLMKTYDFSLEDIDYIKSGKVILFTQPLYPDFVSKEEHEKIYRSIISNYSAEELLIKPHPRDSFQYETISSNLRVFRKRIPSQFFDMLGIHFNTAATVSSSAVMNFEYPIKIDWFGTECSSDLFKVCGHIEPPKGACLKDL